MKKLFKKIIRTSSPIVIACIVVYGSIYAQQAYCGTAGDDYLQRSDIISGCYTSNNPRTISPSYCRNIQLPSNICSNNFLANSGAESTCCETDRCDSHNQVTYFSFQFIQDFYALQKNASFFDSGNGAQTAIEPYSLSIALKTVPIYITTRSIIR